MTQEAAARLIESAVNPVTLFGSNPKKRYAELSRLLHPDTANELKPERAQAVFAKLSTMYASLKEPPKPHMLGSWSVKNGLAKGDVADLYLVSSKDRPFAVLKIAQSERDNDLMAAEAGSLRLLHAGIDEGVDNLNRYMPRLYDSFHASGRAVNVLEYTPKLYSLRDILSILPDGLDFRHVVWMMNRLLTALGFAHQRGCFHGAVWPEHLLYNPESHNLKLIDWCYSGALQAPMKARVKEHITGEPPEIKRKMPVGPSTDIFMAAQSFRFASSNVPIRFRALFDHCLAASPNSRPQDAWQLLERWLATAEAEYGPPKYLKLELPIH